MVRHLRLSFENTVYYITARGNKKEKIFYSGMGKGFFWIKLKKIKRY